MYQLLIVDDDLIIRRGLSQAIPWEEYGIRVAGTAGDGQAALEMMAENVPDIVIADIRMPLVDGLEFTKRVRAGYPEVKVILLTAHKDFEYAKTALRLNVCDYLLKPVDNRALLDVVIRAALAKTEQERISRKLEESEPLLLQRFLLGLIEERYSEEEYRAKLELLEIGKFDRAELVAAVIKADEYYQWNDRNERESRKEALFRIVAELAASGRGLVIDSGQDEMVLIYAASGPEGREAPLAAHRMAERISRIVRERTGTTVTIGIGKPCDGLLRIGRSYAEACSGLEIRHIVGGDQVIFGGDPPETPENVAVDVYPAARELMGLLKLGLLDDSLALLDRIETRVRSERVALEQLQLIGTELAVLLCAEVKGWPEIGAELSRTYDFYQFNLEIRQARTVSEAFGKLREGAGAICAAVNRFRKSLQQTLIEQATDYIAANYSREISLQDVAGQIHLSPTYLSNIFKKEKGINFSDFLLELRMKKAMELLRGGDYKVYEVAELVGYNNVHYFSASFKKYTGTSPTDFKNS